MPAEKYVTEFVKEAGFTPIPDRTIIVTYAPANMSERVVKFFSNEFFANVPGFFGIASFREDVLHAEKGCGTGDPL